MGMAHKAPLDTYNRKYNVTDHAVQRLRERLPDPMKAMYRVDADLINALDKAVFDAVQQKKYETIVDGEDTETSLVVNIGDSFDDCHALVKTDTKLWSGLQYVATVLSTEMVEKNKANPGWGWKFRGSVDSKLGSLAEKLRPLVDAKAISPVAPAAPTEKSLEDIAEALRRVLISIPGSEAVDRIVSVSEAKEMVANHLSAGHSRDHITVMKALVCWKPVETKVKVLKVEVDL